MTAGVLAVLVVPVVGALVTALVGGPARWLAGVLAAAVGTLGALQVAGATLVAGAGVSLLLHGPLGIEVVLVVDGLGAAMLAMAAVVVLGVTGFAAAEDHRAPDRRHAAYWPLVLALWWGLNVLFLAGDLLTLYLMLELVGACGALLVTLRGGVGSLLAGARYFYAELAASTTMLAGLALVWSQAGTLVLADLDASLLQGGPGPVGLAAITVGLLLKVPLAPLHLWLTPAHSLAPSAVSPLLSAVMVKVAFVVLLRIWVQALPGALGPAPAQLLGALGAFAVLWGSLLALRATGLKQLIAASTVAQLGLLFLLFPLVVAGAVDGWSGGVFLAVAHAPAKAAMLMAAATVVDSARRAGVATPIVAGAGSAPPGPEGDATSWPVLEGLRGSAARRPTAVLAFGVAGLAMVGLPPSGGFVGKWYLLLGSVRAGQWWWVAVVVVGTLLTAAYLMRFVRPAMAPSPRTVVAERDARDVVALALAGLAVVLGLWPGPLLDLLAVGGPGPGG